MYLNPVAVIAFITLFVLPIPGQAACNSTLTPHYPAPSVASGYEAKLVATGLVSPRSITFDLEGHLLVVQAGNGIVSLSLNDDGGSCISVGSTKQVISSSSLNHGIALSNDGKTLYASSAEAAFSWDYDSATSQVGTANETLVSGMSTSDHTTRTLLMSRKQNGTLIVSRGSTANVDPAAEVESTGHSQVKAFDLTNRTAVYNFDTDGKLLGWGLRNSVGVAEEPVTGNIFSVENSVDQLSRDGQDIHEDNPGEELNSLGSLADAYGDSQAGNYGYPFCFAAWAPSELPNNSGISVGSQFAIGSANNTVNDSFCQSDRVAPRLTFQAHMAPLDILFLDNGTEAYVTFHGSWDRTIPVGYKLSLIHFSNGSPVEPSNSTTAALDIVTNANNSNCPNDCFRPVGLASDSQGRIYMSSDATGEIYVVLKTTSNVSNTTSGGEASGMSSSQSPSQTSGISSNPSGSTSSMTSSGAAGAAQTSKIYWSGTATIFVHFAAYILQRFN
ncbi:MAG: hypothetical protein M1819_000144 [Sarea resinae]|nr:MAG: hypothetical protein M1819_000144 [Sarea resinae]